MQLEDEELQEMIDAAVAGEAERSYLPLKSRLRLKKELFDSFRRLDILQELVDDPDITEIMPCPCSRMYNKRKCL